MGPDHGAEARLLLDLRLRTQVADHLLELAQPLRRIRMRDTDAQRGLVARLRGERVDELLKRLTVAAHALEGDHLTVADREDRLDVHQLPRERLRLPDATAACEELE